MFAYTIADVIGAILIARPSKHGRTGSTLQFKYIINFNYFFIYFVFLPLPIILIALFFTIVPNTTSTVVGLTSGKILHISAFEIGVKLFNTVASILAFFITVYNTKSFV